MPSKRFMDWFVAVHWKDSIVVLNARKRCIIWIYNLWTEQWRKYELPPAKYLPVNDHQCGVEIKSDIYMFGGFSHASMLWKLARSADDSFAWNRIEFKGCKKTPSLRKGHSVWEYNENMWIFGGFGVSPAGYINDHGDFAITTASLNGTDYGCNNQLLSYDPVIQTWTNVPCSGDVPAPQSDASTAILKNKVYLLLAWPSNEPVTSNMYVLDMHSVTWSRIETTGLIRRHRHDRASLTPATINQLVFHDYSDIRTGVTWICDVQSHTWKKHLENKVEFDHDHKGMTGLHGCTIILGQFVQPDGRKYNPVITVRLEPRSLQQLAMQTIYHKVDPALWEMLPEKLTWVLNNKL